MSKIRTHYEVRFADLVDPSVVGTQAPFHTFSGEVAMGVYEWLLSESMRMSDPKRELLYWPGAFHAVTGTEWRHRNGKLIDVSPFRWRRWLANRFRHVLLTQRGPRTMAARFFASIGVGLNTTRVVPVRHHEGRASYEIDDLAEKIGRYIGRTLAKSYNPSHPGAVEIHDIRFQWDGVWWASIRYGFPWPNHGSNWTLGEDDVPALRPRIGEGFGEFVRRVAAELDSLVVPTANIPWSVYAIFESQAPYPQPRLGYVFAPTRESAHAYWRATYGGANVGTRDLTRAAHLPADALDRRCALRLTNARVGEYRTEDDGRSDEIRDLLEAMAVPPVQRSHFRPSFQQRFKGDFDE